MIVSALERDIKKGDKLIDTSGNTGIALAMIAQLLGIEIELYYQKIQQRTYSNHACLWRNGHIDTHKEGILGSETMPIRSAEGGYHVEQFANEDNWKHIIKQPVGNLE
jgi:cysteine synthase B